MTRVEFEKYIPRHILGVLDRFQEAGVDAYLVGGCVRDILLGRPLNDFDITSAALPERTAELFSDCRIIETGLKHGTLTVIIEGEPVEITTFRIDGDYKDSRHPENVVFTHRVEDDLARRDFTVNAMAYNPWRGLIDPFGGEDDLAAKIIRAVGEPEKRFTEDALRIMRAFRFSAVLGFEIEESTLFAACRCKEGLENIARERIGVEFSKLLLAPDPCPSLEKMRNGGILEYVTGGYCPDASLLPLLSQMPLDEGARLGFFLSQADGEQARKIISGLKRSNIIMKSALATIRGSKKNISDEVEARRLIALCGVYANNAAVASVLLKNSPCEAIRWISENTAPCTLRQLAVTGKDLMAAGLEGRAVGKALDAALAAVIKDPDMNQKERLIDFCLKRK